MNDTNITLVTKALSEQWIFLDMVSDWLILSDWCLKQFYVSQPYLYVLPSKYSFDSTYVYKVNIKHSYMSTLSYCASHYTPTPSATMVIMITFKRKWFKFIKQWSTMVKYNGKIEMKTDIKGQYSVAQRCLGYMTNNIA